MKYYINHFFVLAFLICICSRVYSQPDTKMADLQIGKPCPNIVLNNVKYYSKTRTSLKDLKGKWLVLDFWSLGCTSCVAAFPHVNEMQKTFQDKVQFILVGRDDEGVKPMYEKFRQKEKLQLPILFDTLLFKYFDVYQVPYIIVLDSDGICRAITYSLSETNLKDLMVGKNPEIFRAFTKVQQEEIYKHFDIEKPFLIGGNCGQDTDYSYRSLFFPWRPGIPAVGEEFSEKPNYMMQFSGITLMDLYDEAYSDTILRVPDINRTNSYGKWYGKPLLELADSSAFQYDFLNGRGIYCYSVEVPKSKATNKLLQETMQRDLQTYFGYKVVVEKRMMPCWKLISKQGAINKLKSNGGRMITISDSNLGQAGTDFVNVPIAHIIAAIWYYHQTEPAFVDETGITGNIDLSMECIMTDIKDIKRALQINGLDLILGVKEMKVIVIKDPL